ncbi:MAG: hypothetical protein JNM45_11690 [Rhizobiales bacterium]|nr:hypothetical protein [Hyphomicrobiales bacterium]
MKFRIAISRRVMLGVAGALLILGGGAGGAAYFGLVPLPWAETPELRGAIEEPEAGHGDKVAEGEHGATADGEHGKAADGDHAAAEGEHGAAADGEHGAAAEGEHGAKAEGEHGAAADGEHGAAAEGEHGAAAGEHGAAAAIPEIVWDIPRRSEFNASVRALMLAQSAAASGRVAQVGSQREAISRIQIALQTFDPKSAHPEELEALGIYLLSGGNPRGLSGLIEDIPSVSPLKKLLRGAHDYVIGETNKAKAILMDVDLSTVSQPLAARISLAQAAMIDPTDTAAQTKALKRAASYAPGTLVEEAAYRRLVALAIKSEDQRAFVRSTRRYMRRFPTSLYIGEFLQNYGQGLLHFEEAKHPTPRSDLDHMLHVLPRGVARTLVMELAKQSTKRGLRDLCLYVTSKDHFRYLSDEGDVQRLKLYGIACNVVEDPEGSKQALVELPAEGLPEEDKALRKDALRLAETMLGETHAAEIGLAAGPEVPDSETSATEVSAAQQLQVSEELLKEAVQ